MLLLDMYESALTSSNTMDTFGLLTKNPSNCIPKSLYNSIIVLLFVCSLNCGYYCFINSINYKLFLISGNYSFPVYIRFINDCYTSYVLLKSSFISSIDLNTFWILSESTKINFYIFLSFFKVLSSLTVPDI